MISLPVIHSETVRKGPEIGGAKTWCNPKSLAPRVILSAGSGDDFLYEHIAAREWPGVVLVTTDCYQFDQATDVLPFFEDSKSNEGDRISWFLAFCFNSVSEIVLGAFWNHFGMQHRAQIGPETAQKMN